MDVDAGLIRVGFLTQTIASDKYWGDSMSHPAYEPNQCDYCGGPLPDRRQELDYWIMQLNYNEPDDASGVLASAHIFEADNIGKYCRLNCAILGIEPELDNRNIALTYPGPGPLETCSTCGGMLDRSQPHRAYELIDATHKKTIKGNVLEPHDSTTLAVVCPQCDGKALQFVEKVQATDSKERSSSAQKQTSPIRRKRSKA